MDRVTRVAIESIDFMDALYPADSVVKEHVERKAVFAATRSMLKTMLSEFEQEEHRLKTLYETDLFIATNPGKPLSLPSCECSQCDETESEARDYSIRIAITELAAVTHDESSAAVVTAAALPLPPT